MNPIVPIAVGAAAAHAMHGPSQTPPKRMMVKGPDGRLYWQTVSTGGGLPLGLDKFIPASVPAPVVYAGIAGLAYLAWKKWGHHVTGGGGGYGYY